MTNPESLYWFYAHQLRKVNKNYSLCPLTDFNVLFGKAKEIEHAMLKEIEN